MKILVSKDLVDFYNLISNVRKKKEFYIIDTYLALIKFLWSWPKFREKKGISLVGPEHDCIVWWRLRLGGSNHSRWWMYHVKGGTQHVKSTSYGQVEQSSLTWNTTMPKVSKNNQRHNYNYKSYLNN